jgi:hypothetical protein
LDDVQADLKITGIKGWRRRMENDSCKTTRKGEDGKLK